MPNIDISSVRSIREKLGIQDSGYVYLHFGGLTERKGTLEILKAIMITDEKTLSNKSFVFAGKNSTTYWNRLNRERTYWYLMNSANMISFTISAKRVTVY